MKWQIVIILTILALPIPSSAAKGELVNNLNDSGYYGYDWPFSSYGGAFEYYWVAFDYDPDGAYLVDQVKIDWVYVGNVSCRDDMNFAIYLEDFDDPPTITFTISEAEYSEIDTGFDYAGRDVYRGDLPLGDDAFTATAGNKYWIALQMDAICDVHVIGWFGVVGDRPWYQDVFGWHQHQWTDECSYALYGEVTGVESASLGEIKALFK